VPFHGREREMTDLKQWCSASKKIRLRLYTGAGGMGKTRLLIETCIRQRADGWCAGFLNSRPDKVPTQIWAALLSGQCPKLIVVDYAENRREDVHALLTNGLSGSASGRIRIVLLARAASEWWNRLKGESDGVGDFMSGREAEWIPLSSVAPSRADREKSYGLAVETFASRLSLPAPQHMPEDLSAPYYMRVLLLHMRALATVQGVSVAGDQGLLDYVLNRERRFWADRGRGIGISEILLDGIGQAMATVTLGGGVRSQDEAIELFRRIPILCDQPNAVLAAIGRVLHETYPGDRWIEPVQPDLLGEHLVQIETDKSPDVPFDIIFGDRQRAS
jgi:hypothetical protein